MQEEQWSSGRDTHSSGTEQEGIMATLGRSLKSPVYLARARRPGMSARTLSSSSDVSLGSNNSRPDDHILMSGINTPARELSQAEAVMSSPSTPPLERSHSQHFPRADPPRSTQQLVDETSSSWRSTSSNSRPIAIELPHLRKFNSAPDCTPPEPLSARGDRPGGYFPLHEDPDARVHRPHPFQPESKKSRPQIQLSLELPSPNRHTVPSGIATMPEPALLAATRVDDETLSNTPVASYLPSGAPDTLLPMGKYYPTNYERRKRNKRQQQEQQLLQEQDEAQQPQQTVSRSTALTSLSSSAKSDSQIPTRSTDVSRHDSEVKRRLQQYQRDMIAQARLAANQVLGGASKTSQIPPASVTLNGVPLRNLQHFGASGIHKPVSPRLLPLGSPGPVTPMDLEGGDGGYLDRGSRVEHSLLPEDARLLRQGASSPLVDTGSRRFF